jgi:hypothetical protein
MENGVKIIIERLKTNPEEFGEGKWLGIVRAYKEFMSAEDRVALNEALRPVIMEKFNEDVLNTLMRTENEAQGELDFGISLNSAVHPRSIQSGTITYKTKGRLITP